MIVVVEEDQTAQLGTWQTKGNQAHLLEGYADNLTLFLKWFRTKGANINQIKAVLKILSLYEDIFGLAVNVTKTITISWLKRIYSSDAF